jgi:Rps23 Pro-64 3,4-dihydroxylase Tpa1-like proline 4-hydroxylase
MFEKFSGNLIQCKNIFPPKVVEKIYLLFRKNKNWNKINQFKPKHYSHVFKSKSFFLPDSSEVYIAKFFKSEKLSRNKFILEALQNYIYPKIEKIFKFNITVTDVRCHKFNNNDFLRTHFDDYASSYAVTINLNKNWKWDWGGLLCVPYGKNFSRLHSLAPMWNTMNVLTSNNIKRSPHFVTSLQPFVKKPRYTITIFIK